MKLWRNARFAAAVPLCFVFGLVAAPAMPSTEAGPPIFESSPGPGQLQTPPIEQELAKTLDEVAGALKPPPESERDYRSKRFDDLYSSPSLWIAGGVLLLVVMFWTIYRKEIRDLISNLQTLKIGDYLQFVKATVVEMRSIGENDHESKNPAKQIAGVSLDNFFSFLDFPADALAETLDLPRISMDWPPLPWLRSLETSLSLQAERLRSSPYFDDERPRGISSRRRSSFSARSSRSEIIMAS